MNEALQHPPRWQVLQAIGADVSRMTDTITEKTGLPLGMVAALALSLMGGVGSFFSLKADVTRANADLVRMEETAKDLRSELRNNEKIESERRNAHELRIQRNEDTQANVLKTLGRIEVQMERFINRESRDNTRGARSR